MCSSLARLRTTTSQTFDVEVRLPTTMTKGKKQHSSPDEILRELEFRSLLSDDAYEAVGALLELGRCRHHGGEVVVVDPVVTPRPRLKFRRSPLGVIAPTLIEALGVQDLLTDALLANLRPRCPS